MVLLAAGYQSFPTVINTAYTLNYDILTYGITPPEAARTFLGTAVGLDDVATQVITGVTSFALPFTATSTVTFAQFETSGGFDAQIDVDNVSCIQETFQTVNAGGLSQLIAGIAANHELTRIFLEKLTHIRDPYKTFILATLEREHGISPDTFISDTDRRDKLAAVKYAKASTGSLSAMQTALDRAFPDLFTVNDNDPPQDPTKFITPQLLSDPDMESTTLDAWTVGNSASLIKSIVAPAEGTRNLVVRRSTVNNPYAFQLVIVTGGVYNISGWGKGDGNASPKVWLGTNSVWTGTSSTSWQYFNVQGETAASANFGVRLEATTSTGSELCEFDDFRLTQTQTGRTIVNGRIHNSHVLWLGACGEAGAQCGEAAIQCGNNAGVIKSLNVYPIPADSQYWPLIFFVGGNALFASVILDGNAEAGDVTAWGVGDSATLTKETTNPHRGLQVLRVAYGGVANPFAFQAKLTIGNQYRVRGWARSDGTAIPRVTNPGFVNVFNGTTSTDWQPFDVTWTATGISFRLKTIIGAAGYTEWDDVSVEPLDVPIHQTECGEALSQCGEPLAQCGSYNGQITSIEVVEVPIERRNDLERLILALKPLHSWGVLFAVYQLILNGDFADDSTWGLGIDWAIAGGECTHTPGTGSSITQLNRGVTAGFSYRITYTLRTVVAGSIQPFVGSTGAGTARTTSGTFTEVITAAGTDSIAWTCTAAFDGIIDDVSVVEL